MTADATPENQPTANPTDTPLIEVEGDLHAKGDDGQFRSQPGGVIECLTCHTDASAAQFRSDDATRLEGVSDPDDMLMIVPVRCPNCGTQGRLIAGYGPMSTAEDADILSALS